LSRAIEESALRQQFDETARGIHGSHGVRTRGTDADLENIENAQAHARNRLLAIDRA
jgi:hypothetical protein